MTPVPENKPPSRRLYSCLLFLGFAFVAFFPCLILNQSYFANDLLASHGQWRAFLRNQLLTGHFPLWNPYFYGGEPFFADPDAMMCYPLNYLTLLFPVPYNLGVFFFLHMFLAACGMYFWLKSLRLSENACRIGALTFASSGLFWWEIIHPPILAVFAFFPWLMACLENLCRKLTGGWAFLTGLCFALIFCGGSFQSTLCVFYTSLAYFLFGLFTREKEIHTPAGPLPWKKILIAFLFVLWGSLPLLTQLVPANEFSGLSNRRDPSQTYDNFTGTFSMVPFTTYEFLFPTLGVPPGSSIEAAIQGITNQKNIDNDFLGAFGYLGVWAPFLFFLAFKRKDKKFHFFILGIGLLAILTGWGRYFPLHRILCAILPGINLSRAPFRYLQAYVLFGSALAAFGYQTLERLFREKERFSGMVLAGCGYAFLLFIVCLARPNQAWREMLALFVGGAGLALWGLTESWKPLGMLSFQSALILPLLLSGWGGYSLGPASNFDLEANFPMFTYLKDHTKGSRYQFDPGLAYPVKVGSTNATTYFPPDAPMVFGIRMNEGYNPIFLKKAMDIKKIPFKNYLKLMSIRGFLFQQPIRETPEISKMFSHQVFGSVHFYQPLDQPGYLYAPSQFQVVPGSGKDLEAMEEEGFDPARQVILNDPLPEGILSQLPGKEAGLKYEISKDAVDEQVFKIHLDANSLVTFSENVFPGWKAWVDGRPSAILTGNHVFRTLFIPAGDHRVEFRYIPAWLAPLLWGMMAWCLSAAAFAFFHFRTGRTGPIAPAKTN